MFFRYRYGDHIIRQKIINSLLRKRLTRTVLIFIERSGRLSRATDRVPGLLAIPGYVQ